METDNIDFVEQALKKHRTDESEYVNTTFILPTSNDVERLFSLTKRVFAPNRQSLKDETLEMLVFLRLNRQLWSVATVSKVRNDPTPEEPSNLDQILGTDDEDEF